MANLYKVAPEEISHPAHPEHMLKLLKTSTHPDLAPFDCHGCMERGAGDRYTCACRPSNYNLHKYCALAEPTLQHPLLPTSRFVLRHAAPSDCSRICDGCGAKVLGFHYHCAKTDLDLHPCCVNLPMEIRHDHEDLVMELRKEASHRCDRCKKKGGFWFYRSTCKTVYLHVACVKNMASEKWGSSSSSITVDDTALTPFVKEAALQNYRGKRSGASDFESMLTKVLAVVRIIIAVIIGDPTPIIAAGFAAAVRAIF